MKAKELTNYCQENFFDSDSALFFFTSKKDDYIIRRTLEITDNVVPASNSIMAKNLFKLSRLFPTQNYEETALQMLKNIQHNFEKNAQNHANWLQLFLFITEPYYEVAIIGKSYLITSQELQSKYLPNTIFSGTEKETNLTLLKDRFVKDNTLVYVCQHGSCQLPQTNVTDVINQLSMS